jgi:hypothetical protein
VIGFLEQERTEQIAGGADDLHAVVTGGARPLGAAHKISDRVVDVLCRHLPRHARVDRRLYRRRRHRIVAVGEIAGVQDLQADATVLPRRVHGVGDASVQGHQVVAIEGAVGAGCQRRLLVRRVAAGDDHAHAAGGALGVVGGHAIKTLGADLLEARVHRAHENTVLEVREAEVQGREQAWKQGVRHGACRVSRG